MDEEKRSCPGERYEITWPICRARQANHYPKCLLCGHSASEPAAGMSSDPKVKAAIFRSTCVAGKVPSEVNEYVVRKVGTAAAQLLRAEAAGVSDMVVGGDPRENSPSLARIFCEGANEGGMNTVSIGQTPPELLRFALSTEELGGAAFIGACHAAENMNGVRLYRRDGSVLSFENGLDKVALIARRTRPGRSRNPGQRDTLDPLPAYRSYVQKFVPRLKAFTIAVDGSCGVAGSIVPRVFEGLPVKVVPTNVEPNGRSPFLGRRFPAAQAQSALRQAVRSSGARLGAAVDFDGDMVAFFDENGEPIANDATVALLARELLTRTPGARIGFDLRYSAAVREEIINAGGQPRACPADPVVLSRAARQKEVLYAADTVGRHFFRDLFGAESPVLAILLMCSLLSRRDEPLSRMAAHVTRYRRSGELRYETPSPEAAGPLFEELRGEFRSAESDGLDGLTIRFPNWWFNLRQPGGTTSLRLTVEGRTSGDERRGRAAVEKIIKKHQTEK